jgi:hypothetical protein
VQAVPEVDPAETEQAMRVETRELLAACYVSREASRRMLTHAVEVDERGIPVKVICGNVRLDSVAERAAMSSPEALQEVPTCRKCSAWWRGRDKR